jgi:hypothetical protein
MRLTRGNEWASGYRGKAKRHLVKRGRGWPRNDVSLSRLGWGRRSLASERTEDRLLHVYQGAEDCRRDGDAMTGGEAPLPETLALPKRSSPALQGVSGEGNTP